MVINGKKWCVSATKDGAHQKRSSLKTCIHVSRWISGAGDPRNAVHLVMGKTDPTAPKHQQQTVVIVPANAPGVKLLRPMKIFGYDDAPEGHLEVSYENVRVPLSNVVGGVGRGFEIIQGRLGPGRLHHWRVSLIKRSVALLYRPLTCVAACVLSAWRNGAST